MTETYYKWLRPGRKATHVPGFIWPEPGEWLEVEGNLVPCRNGLHVLRTEHVLLWYEPGWDLWRVEVDGERLDRGAKMVVRRARLLERVPDVDRRLQLFAADCAERVLHLFEQANPGDDRPRMAIESVRRAGAGGAAATAAASAAAWAEGGLEAWDAAWAAIWAVRGRPLEAAASASSAAAYAKVPSSDQAHGSDAEESDWQSTRLTHYLEGRIKNA